MFAAAVPKSTMSPKSRFTPDVFARCDIGYVEPAV